MTTLLEALRRIESARDVHPIAPSAVAPVPMEIEPVDREGVASEPIAREPATIEPAAPVRVADDIAPPTEIAPAPQVEVSDPAHAIADAAPLPVDLAAELGRDHIDESCDAAARAFIQLHPHMSRLVFASCGSVDDAAATVAALAEALKRMGRAPIEVLGPGAFHLRQVSRDARLAGNLDEFVHAPAEFVFSHAELFRNFDGALLVVEQQQTAVAQADQVRRKLEKQGLTVSGVLYVTRHD